MKRYYVICICVIILLSGCNQGNNHQGNTNFSNISETYESLKTKYKNLVMDDFQVSVPENVDLKHIIVKGTENQYTIESTEFLKLLESLIQVLKGYFGDNIDVTKVQVEVFKGDDIQDYYYTSDFIQDIKSGKFDGKQFNMIWYENESQYFHIFYDMTYLYVYKGESDHKVKGASFSKQSEFAQCIAKPERIYYRDALDGSLEDEYQLYDGKMSIADGIKCVEEYLNGDLYIPKEKNLKRIVEKVYVYELADNVYEYYFTFRRSYDGIRFDVAQDGMAVNSNSDNYGVTFDRGAIGMFECNKIEVFYSLDFNNDIEEVGDTVKSVISLQDAMDQVSKKASEINEAAIYQIHSIELSYRLRQLVEDETKSEGYPVWKVETTNQQDNTILVFYVNVETGEVETSEY